MMVIAEAAALLEEAFGYPEHASFFCPIRTRNRLLGLLSEGSPLVYRRDGFLAWLSAGGHFVLYLGRSAEVLARHMPEAVRYLAPHARTEGAVLGNVYVTSAATRDLFLSMDFKLDDGLQRMRHDHPGPLPDDPRIRAMRPEDVEPLAVVGQRAFPEQDWTPELWSNPIRNSEATWVAEHEGRPVGFLLASAMEEFSLITGLGVDPTVQGRGLGKALINKSLTEAHAQGLTGVEVHANDRPQAVNTYLRCGFHVKHPAWALSAWWAKI